MYVNIVYNYKFIFIYYIFIINLYFNLFKLYCIYLFIILFQFDYL